MTSEKFHRVFGGPPRRPESPITEREMDIAASIQKVTEDVMLNAARHVHAQTGLPNLCLAGGVALNCVANGRIQREGPFEKIWVQPASGDAGGALGAALHVWHQLLDEPRRPEANDSMNGSLLGPAATASDLRSFLAAKDARFTEYPDDASLCEAVADLMAREHVVGWFQGRMELAAGVGAQHHRRCAQRVAAIDDEPEDQIP